MPYLALHDRLRAALRRPDVVILTCGYSFRDDHLNEVIQEGLARNASAVVFSLLHSELGKYEDAVAVAERVGNLLLLASDGAVVGRGRGRWRRVDDPGTAAGTPGITINGDQPVFHLGDFTELASLLGELAGGQQ